MESHAKYAMVGFIVIVLTVMVVAAILWLSETGTRRNTKTYVIYFKDHSLDGLQVDGDVTMKGIKVGNVTNFAIAPTDIERVKVEVSIKEETPIKVDTKAVIRRNLLTGLAYIDLAGSSQESKLRKGVPKDEEYPVIPEGITELEAFADSLPGLIENVNDMVTRVSTVFSEDNRQAVSSTLQNVERFTAALAKNDEEIGKMVANLNKLSEDIRKIGESFHQTALNTDTQLTRVSDEFVSALGKVREVSDNIDREASSVAQSIRSTSQVIAVEASNLAQSVDEATEAFSATVEGFENPGAILGGPAQDTLGPGETILK